MPKTTFAGHALHPQIINVPAALIPTSLVLDIMYRNTGKESYAEASYYCLVGGTVGGVAAGLAGFADYGEIPANSEVKKTGRIHGLLNVSALALSGANILLRRGKNPPTGALPLALSAVTNAGLLLSAWLGGQLVYDYGMRVKGVSPVANAPELKLPGDDAITHALERAERAI